MLVCVATEGLLFIYKIASELIFFVIKARLCLWKSLYLQSTYVGNFHVHFG